MKRRWGIDEIYFKDTTDFFLLFFRFYINININVIFGNIFAKKIRFKKERLKYE